VKVAPRPSSGFGPLAPVGTTGTRESLRAPAIGPEGDPIGCVRCVDPPCRTMVDESGAHTAVCPTDAIGAMTETGIDIDPGACIGCGVCILRCPTGAILLDGVMSVTVETPSAASQPIDADDQARILAGMSLVMVDGSSWRHDAADSLVVCGENLTQKPFYRLVASLFELAGFRADLGHGGDTSSRFDLLLPDANDSIPVEIKSRTETEFINVKSIQQAVENKIVVDNRDYPSRPESSTLVVGWDYPPMRSDVSELIADVHGAFGISVGMISLRALYRLALEARLLSVRHERTLINSLRGPL
jgi:Fe-S-cluster-containing hydrogenase component 2